jgi:purine-binding chemotaxis protein CheW
LRERRICIKTIRVGFPNCIRPHPRILSSQARKLDHRATPFLIVQAGLLRCALPLSAVREVMRPLPIKTAAGLPPAVLGASIVRGVPLPVVSLPLLLNQPETTGTRFVVVRTPGSDCVLAVDGVDSITRMDSAQWQALPNLLRRMQFAGEIAAADEDLAVTLDLGRVVAELKLAEELPE